MSYGCVSLSVLQPSNLPVAILWRSVPHGERLAETQQAESIALTITTFPPHGSLSVVDLSLSGHIIVFKMPVVDPTKHKVSFPLYRLEKKHDILSAYRGVTAGS